MERFVITGGNVLQGAVTIQGAKNALQKVVPATVAFPSWYTLHNVPLIHDTLELMRTLEYLGAQVQLTGHTLSIDTRSIHMNEISPEVTAETTGSFLFAGALLARFGSVTVWYPGRDRLGKRPVDTHLEVFRQLGASVHEESSFYRITAPALQGTSIALSRQSANGTANALLAASAAQGTTILSNASQEPEIDNLVELLQHFGLSIQREAPDRMIISGTVEQHDACTLDIIPDRNDAATFAVIGALVGQSMTLEHLVPAHLKPLLDVFQTIGIPYEETASSLTITRPKGQFISAPLTVTSMPYPGFSTDWGPMLHVLMTQIPATSYFHETIFQRRFAHVEPLQAMGAHIDILHIPDIEPLYQFSWNKTEAQAQSVDFL